MQGRALQPKVPAFLRVQKNLIARSSSNSTHATAAFVPGEQGCVVTNELCRHGFNLLKLKYSEIG